IDGRITNLGVGLPAALVANGVLSLETLDGRLFDFRTMEPSWKLKYPITPQVRTSLLGDFLAVGTNPVRIYNLAAERLHAEIATSSVPTHLASTPDGSTLAAVLKRRRIDIRKIGKGDATCCLDDYPDDVISLAISPNGEYVATILGGG